VFANHHSAVQRILVFRIGELGDTIVSLPALRAIRENFPSAHIALLGNIDSKARNVDARAVLPSKGLIDDWISYEARESLIGSFRLLKTLRRSRYDLVVYLAPRIRRARDTRRDLFFFRLAGVKRILGARGFEPLPRSPSGATLPVVQETDHLLQRLSLDGIVVPPPNKAKIDLALTDEERDSAREWLSRNVPPDKILVGVGPGSKWPSKIWPEERFAAFGQSLIAQQNVFPLVLGSTEDRALGERLLHAWGKGANAAGVLRVREAAAALASCRAYVGNDTGTMHLAAAVGTPCVVVMSALDWPGHWNPYGSGHIVLRRSVPCEGCLLRVCYKEQMRCLREISVDEVVRATKKVLSNYNEAACDGMTHERVDLAISTV